MDLSNVLSEGVFAKGLYLLLYSIALRIVSLSPLGDCICCTV